MNGFYVGVGSRRTPTEILAAMFAIAESLAARGMTLRSGHADGADLAFERGAHAGAAAIFLPWPTFNSSNRPVSARHRYYSSPSEAALRDWIRFHPNPAACTQAAARCHARNLHELMGYDYTLSGRNFPPGAAGDFVVCWTPDGAERASQCSAATGGTGTVIRAADHFGVPVFNLARTGRADDLQGFLRRLDG
jgi:hypothetical protein